MLHTRLYDMNGTNMVLLAGHVPGQARPSLCHWHVQLIACYKPTNDARVVGLVNVESCGRILG